MKIILSIRDQNPGTDWLKGDLIQQKVSLRNRYRAPEAKLSVTPRMLSHDLWAAGMAKAWSRAISNQENWAFLKNR